MNIKLIFAPGAEDELTDMAGMLGDRSRKFSMTPIVRSDYGDIRSTVTVDEDFDTEIIEAAGAMYDTLISAGVVRAR